MVISVIDVSTITLESVVFNVTKKTWFPSKAVSSKSPTSKHLIAPFLDPGVNVLSSEASM